MTVELASRVVTAVVPAYNAEPFVGEAIRSILAQDYHGVEVIVVDDGSQDKTYDIASSFPGVQCIRKPNGGQASARNVGIRAARGQFVAFLDADDVWEPNKLTLQIRKLEETGLRWAYSDCGYYDERLEHFLYPSSTHLPLRDGNVLKPLLFRNFIPSATPIVGRDIFDRVGLFDEAPELRKREDWDLWLRIAAEYRIAVVRLPLAKYRLHSKSGLRTESVAEALQSNLRVLQKARRRMPGGAARWLRKATANAYLSAALAFFRLGNANGARECCRKAVAAAPTNLKAHTFSMLCNQAKFACSTALRLRELYYAVRARKLKAGYKRP